MNNFLPIGERLKDERLRLRFNQNDFALEANITRKTLFSYETGVRAPDAGALAVWAKMGLDVAFVVTGERVQPPSDILEPEEKVLINAYRQLTDKSKKEILLSIIACDEDKKQKSKKKKTDALVNVKGQNNNIKTVNSKKVKGGIVIK